MRSLILKSFAVFAFSAALGVVFGYYVLYRQSVKLTDGRDALQFELLEACRYGDLNEMERLVRAGASVSRFADNGYMEPSGPPILEAAENARPEAVKWLLDRGATWDVFVADGWTPLGAAEVKKRDAEKTIEILRTAGAKHRDER